MDLQAEIQKLRDQCNATIKLINLGRGVNTPGFHTINNLLKQCDNVFRASDLRNQDG